MGFQLLDNRPISNVSAVRETSLGISQVSFNEIRPDLSLSCNGLGHGSNIKYMIYLTIKWWTMDGHDPGMIVLDHIYIYIYTYIYIIYVYILYMYNIV